MTATVTPSTTPTRPPTRWYRRPWVGPGMLIAGAFVVFSLPRYLTLDPEQSRVNPIPDVALYYPALVLHVVCGSIAILTCCFQIWPKFRAKHPAGHRATGRIYVLGGVLPGGLAGLYIGANTPFGLSAMFSDVMLSLLWLGVTAAGFQAARRRDFGMHRRWMVRSFALTMSIVINRVVGIPLAMLLVGQGYTQAQIAASLPGVTTWVGWTTALLAAEWWLERDVRRSRRRPVRS